jgi:hypothetical protein
MGAGATVTCWGAQAASVRQMSPSQSRREGMAGSLLVELAVQGNIQADASAGQLPLTEP